jgi:hypothetical protein
MKPSLIFLGATCLLSVGAETALAAQPDSKPESAEPAVATAPAPAAAPQEAPAAPAKPAYVPHGFTMEIGIGAAYTSASSSVSSHEHQAFGLAPISLSLGGFLGPDLALVFRAAGTSYFRDANTRAGFDQVVTGFYGAVLQYWPSSSVFIGGGIGAAIYGTNPLIRSTHKFIEGGFGTTARVGWVFATMQDKYAFSLVFEGFPTFTKDSTVVGSALNLQWQLL